MRSSATITARRMFSSSASVHEGFCVPIVEAMHHGVPVVALSAAAVPETVGGAGLLIESASPATMAAAVHSVVDDSDLRDRLVRAGRARAGELSLERSRATMRHVLERWIDGRGRFGAPTATPFATPAATVAASL